MNNYQYPVELEDNKEGGFILKFRDFPDLNSEIWSLDELQNTGLSALITILDLYFEHNKVFPKPSAHKENEKVITLPISIIAKMLLLNTMVSSKIRPVDLARKMGVKPQEVNRIIDLTHNTRIDTIQKALNSLGKSLTLSLS
jgi:antitoxin HicB|uniref:type II toxin-antitoxin system HicB family antitoxin n=1 Tax=Succinivibrio sp. TaxID=2053619 RepID=UPI00402AE6A4